MDAILERLEQRGHTVARGGSYKQRITVRIGETDLEFYMREGQTRRPFSSKESAELVWSGKLELQLADFYLRGVRQSWRDGRRRQLEDAVGDFVAELETAARIDRQHSIEVAKRQLEREEAARRRESEQRRIADLWDRIGRWEKASSVRGFVEAVAADAVEPNDVTRRWIRWARAYAYRLDPLGEALPDIDKVVARHEPLV